MHVGSSATAWESEVGLGYGPVENHCASVHLMHITDTK